MAQAKLSLLDEQNFWIYQLQLQPGPIGPDSFLLTGHRDGQPQKLSWVGLELDLRGGTHRCKLRLADGEELTTRLVNIQT